MENCKGYMWRSSEHKLLEESVKCSKIILLLAQHGLKWKIKTFILELEKAFLNVHKKVNKLS